MPGVLSAVILFLIAIFCISITCGQFLPRGRGNFLHFQWADFALWWGRNLHHRIAAQYHLSEQCDFGVCNAFNAIWGMGLEIIQGSLRSWLTNEKIIHFRPLF